MTWPGIELATTRTRGGCSTLGLAQDFTLQWNLYIKTTHGNSTIRSLFAGSFMQKMSNWENKSVVAVDKEMLFKGGL